MVRALGRFAHASFLSSRQTDALALCRGREQRSSIALDVGHARWSRLLESIPNTSSALSSMTIRLLNE